MNATVITFTVIAVLFLYAIIFEINEHHHAYASGKPDTKDGLLRSIRKLEDCIRYEDRLVKWRRVLISACIITAMMFGLVHRRVPTAKELLLYVFLIFLVLTLNRANQISRSSLTAIRYHQQNLANVKKELASSRSFLSPVVWDLS